MAIGEMISSIFTAKFLQMIIRMSSPLFFASMASFAAATTGIGNIAIEGIMTMTALFGILGSYWTQSAFFGLLIGIAVGILIAVGIAFFSMKMGASSSLVGIALNTFSSSLATFFLYQFTGTKGTSASLLTQFFGNWDIPIIKDIPIIGQFLSGQFVLTYVAWACIILMYILIYKTPLGMRMRACGLNPDAARTAGINVERLQVLSLAISGMLAALGGMLLSLNYIKLYSNNMVSGQGWMGIAANGIASGNYLVLLIATLFFAVFRAISVYFVGTGFPSELISAIPYIAVFFGLSIFSIVNTYRTKKGNVSEQ